MRHFLKLTEITENVPKMTYQYRGLETRSRLCSSSDILVTQLTLVSL